MNGVPSDGFTNRERELIKVLQDALSDRPQRAALLQRPDALKEIMNSKVVRGWLFDQWQIEQRQIEQQQKEGEQYSPNHVRSLIVDIMRSSRMMLRSASVSQDILAEAYSRTWKWFFKNLPQYAPEIASFVTWFNNKLRWKIRDILREEADRQKREMSIDAGDSGKPFELPAPAPVQWKDTIRDWLDTLETHQAEFCRRRMRESPQVDCYKTLSQALQNLLETDDESWEAIATQFSIQAPSLQRFCRSRCYPIFKRVS